MKKTIKKKMWDAILDTDVCDPYNNADLTIVLKLGFKQINPAGGATTGSYNDYGEATKTARKIVKWSPSEWVAWKQNFVMSAQKYWHGKFWLINNLSALEYETDKTKYFPNIWCKFQLSGSDATPATKHHHVIDVVRLDKTERWFGSHSRLYDNLDTKSVQKGRDKKGKAIMQRAHVHEIGHLLGLGHVDIGKLHCPSSGNTNSALCYGVADIDKNSVMGQGMQLNGDHAYPWRQAIVELTKVGNLSKVIDWQSKQIRHYPRTAAEVAANTQLTTRPKR